MTRKIFTLALAATAIAVASVGSAQSAEGYWPVRCYKVCVYEVAGRCYNWVDKCEYVPPPGAKAAAVKKLNQVNVGNQRTPVNFQRTTGNFQRTLGNISIRRK